MFVCPKIFVTIDPIGLILKQNIPVSLVMEKLYIPLVKMTRKNIAHKTYFLIFRSKTGTLLNILRGEEDPLEANSKATCLNMYQG